MYPPIDLFRRNSPGDNSRTPLEIIAAEQRIITFADALITWMYSEEMSDIALDPKIAAFMTHETQYNPGGLAYGGTTKHMILERTDPDANRLFIDLLRAAWERRCWQAKYGMRASPHE